SPARASRTSGSGSTASSAGAAETARPADPDLTRGPRPVGFPFVMRPVIVAALLLALVQVSWAEVLGGGLANTACRPVVPGVSAPNANSGAVGTDGDPSCDADGVADGACHCAVRLCTGTATSGCDTATFSSISVAGLHVSPPHVPAPDGTCGPTTDLEVPVGMPSGTTVLGRDGNELRDVDYLQLCSVSAAPTPPHTPPSPLPAT